MASEVKYAPREVIDELDAWTGSATTVGDLLTDIEKMRNGFTGLTREFIVGKDSDLRDSIEFIPYELAVIEHKFGTERLQPKRETRWTVRKIINGYNKSLVFENGETNFHEYTDRATYMFGLTEEQACGYAELFGGEPVELFGGEPREVK